MDVVSKYPPSLVSQMRLKQRMAKKAERASRAYEIACILESSYETRDYYFRAAKRTHFAWERSQKRLSKLRAASDFTRSAH